MVEDTCNGHATRCHAHVVAPLLRIFRCGSSRLVSAALLSEGGWMYTWRGAFGASIPCRREERKQDFTRRPLPAQLLQTLQQANPVTRQRRLCTAVEGEVGSCLPPVLLGRRRVGPSQYT